MRTVEKVIEYLMYKDHYKDAKEGEEIPDFCVSLLQLTNESKSRHPDERIPVEIVLELLVAADYINC